MKLVAFVLKRPYTVVAALILVCILGAGAVMRMPVDIFPEIDIPVVSVVWTYNGISAEDMQNRILSLHERQMASLVDDISRIEWHLTAPSRVQKAQTGSYEIADNGDGSATVTYELSVELSIGMMGMFKRKAEKVIMDTALKELKRRVEAKAV